MKKQKRCRIPLAVVALLALVASAHAQFTTAPGSPFRVGAYPRSIQVADLNGDGKPDLVTVLTNNVGLAILFGDGAGGFTPASGSPLLAGPNPVNVTVADVNGDGKPDLVVEGSLGVETTVTILLGDGAGHFSATGSSPISLGQFSRLVALADLNGDGKLDLIVDSPGTLGNDNLTLWAGDGKGGFTQAPGAPIWSGPGFQTVAVGDFDGDGKTDLVVSSGYAATVLLANGSQKAIPNGSFGGWGVFPAALAVADVNGDGKLDLVAIPSTPGARVTVLLGDGTGGFTPSEGSPFPAGSNPFATVVGDFNGDGYPDIAILGDTAVTVLLGDGMGHFVTPPGNPFHTPNSTSFAAADFNGDGRTDLAVASYADGTVTVLLGGPPAQIPLFSTPRGNPFQFSWETHPFAVTTGDFNRDGNLDLATTNLGVGILFNLSVLLGDGTGAFTAVAQTQYVAGSGPDAIAVADFNGDGALDLAIADEGYWGSKNALVLLDDGTGVFAPAPGSPYPPEVGASSVVAGDFNGDGKPDLAVAAGDNTVTILLGDGTGRFAAAAGSPFAVGSSPGFLVTGDFNRDGKLDLAVANQGSNNVTVLLGDGRGGFTPAPGSPFPVGKKPAALAVADFNSDGNLDLAVANSGDNNVTILLGDGSGGFTPAARGPIPAGSSPCALAAADFNGDGKPDLAISNCNLAIAQSSDNTVTILLGDGTGAFTPVEGSPFPVGLQPTSIAIGDFNRDGRPDLAIANYGDDTLTILLNNIPAPVTLVSPADKAIGVSLAVALVWNGSTGAASYDVYFGATFPPPRLATTTALTWSPGTLVPGATYYWRIVARGASGAVASAIWSFTTGMGLPQVPVLTLPINGATDALVLPTLVWQAAAGATSYDVYVGTTPRSSFAANVTGTTYAPSGLRPNSTYYWRVDARNAGGTASSDTWMFITGSPESGLLFMPVTPCRVVDTRNPDNEFGGPALTAGSTRSFTIPRSPCGIPSTALAYSLNMTVVPDGPLSYLTIWPGGQPQPWVSTLNSWEGTVVANAAIVPAGSDGSVSVYVTNATHLILDINGYFDTRDHGARDFFYAATPCRIADTRGPNGAYGGPALSAGQAREFSVWLSPCGISSNAEAFSLNVTAVPDGPLGYVSVWGGDFGIPPNVSTLNSWTGAVVANAAIVGGMYSVWAYASDPTNLVLDVNGYFQYGDNQNAFLFYPVTPCRLADTRDADGSFGGPEMQGGTTRSFAAPAGRCNIPSNAQAYSLNVTVVPSGPMPYLTAWPAGSPEPMVSTLNSFPGNVVANAAIVPAGPNGVIDIAVAGSTHVILDINGYFAP